MLCAIASIIITRSDNDKKNLVARTSYLVLSFYLCTTMPKAKVSQAFSQSPQLRKLQNTIAQSQEDKTKTTLTGLVGSATSFVIAEAFNVMGPSLVEVKTSLEYISAFTTISQIRGE